MEGGIENQIENAEADLVDADFSEARLFERFQLTKSRLTAHERGEFVGARAGLRQGR